jgi:hypothetical protein
MRSFSSLGLRTSLRFVTEILIDSRNIISLAFISCRMRFGRALRSNVCESGISVLEKKSWLRGQ